MIAKARGLGNGVEYDVLDLRAWRPDAPVDVLVSNAVLQWVDDHLDLLPGWVAGLAPGGWLRARRGCPLESGHPCWGATLADAIIRSEENLVGYRVAQGLCLTIIRAFPRIAGRWWRLRSKTSSMSPRISLSPTCRASPDARRLRAR
ncbi:class I SAM-dependent methyltransferase [Sinosporangium album]|uniref:class I SAM-dependent methyltransferase n=1 Tax=Sinosporangium album TaxID=504805 RepID=UPI003B83978A